MKCAICKNGHTEAGLMTVTLEKEQTILIIKNVPANICDNCGEEYLSAEVNKILLARAKEEYNRGVSLELLDYAA